MNISNSKACSSPDAFGQDNLHDCLTKHHFKPEDVQKITELIAIAFDNSSQKMYASKKYFQTNDAFVSLNAFANNMILHIEAEQYIHGYNVKQTPQGLVSVGISDSAWRMRKNMQKTLRYSLQAKKEEFTRLYRKVEEAQKKENAEDTYIIAHGSHELFIRQIDGYLELFPPGKFHIAYDLNLYKLNICNRNLLIEEYLLKKLRNYLSQNQDALFEMAKKERDGCVYIYRAKKYPLLNGSPPMTLAVNSVSQKIFYKYKTFALTQFKKVELYRETLTRLFVVVTTSFNETETQRNVAQIEANNFRKLKGEPGLVILHSLISLCGSNGNKNKIMMDFYDLIDLREFLKQHILTDEIKFKFFKEIAKGYLTLHNNGLIYGDGKHPNYFIRTGSDGKPEAALGDFGLTMPHGHLNLSGSAGYLAPEILEIMINKEKNTGADFSRDVWTMCFTFLMLEDKDKANTLKLAQQDLVDLPKSTDERIADFNLLKVEINSLVKTYTAQTSFPVLFLIGLGLNIDPAKRPTSKQIVEGLEMIEKGSSVQDLKNLFQHQTEEKVKSPNSIENEII